MCGIFTYLGSGALSVQDAITVISHRGPDAEGHLTYSIPERFISRDMNTAGIPGPKVTMGFRRLAIIDLNTHSNQPFSDESGLYHIVFNGEIYNYQELRAELKSLGTRFITDSDTEVLLKSYMQWGADCLPRFNGMWAFVILDLKHDQLFVARDRFGIKPLYYSATADGVSFFSEIKQAFKTGIPKRMNPEVVRDFLESAVLDAGEETFFAGIQRFPASHFAFIPLNGNSPELRSQRYFDLAENHEVASLSYQMAQERFLELFTSSIELRFRSDVPVGACLSGGLDSSSIVSMAGYLGKHIKAFTVDNHTPELSEYRFVRSVIDKYPGISSVVTYNDDADIDLLDNVFAFQDEPISGMGVIAQWKVMELARRNNVTVLLDGQGGDEIFGGYRKFVFFYLKQLLRSGNILLALKEASHFLTQNEFRLFEKEGVRRYLNRTGIASYLSPEALTHKKAHNIGISGVSGFRQKSYEDIFRYSYPQLLRYEDRNSMAFSLESRVPFLDYRLVSFVYALPEAFKIKNGFTKALLRESLKGILPDEVRLRKSKLGFATPEEIWLTQAHHGYFRDYFRRMNNPFLMNTKIAEDFEGKSHLDYKSMIRLYLFDRWYQYTFSS